MRLANKARRRKFKIQSAKIDRRFEVLSQFLECEKIYRRRRKIKNIAEKEDEEDLQELEIGFLDEAEEFDFETEFKLVQMNFTNGRQSLYDLDADVEVSLLYSVTL
jgi:hypothetical protein